MVLRSGRVAWESHINDPTNDLSVVIIFLFLFGGDGKDGMESTVRPDL